MSNNIIKNIRRRLQSLATRPENTSRFFKTGPGDYAEGDIFIGVNMGNLRDTAKEYADLDFTDIETLLYSSIHEERSLALILLVNRYNKDKEAVYHFYTKHMKQVNNWDLVDISAPYITGRHLYGQDTAPLYQWAASPHLWTKRIAMVSTWYFIRQHHLEDTFCLAKALMYDKHDLIHKAVGWMLREAGKKDVLALQSFLDEHAHHLPRTLLRYAIERLAPEKRRHYLSMKALAY